MLEAIKEQVQKIALDIEQEMWEAALFIHEHPELGDHEFLAAERLTGLLKQHGFTVELGIAGRETAFRGTYELQGNTSPTVAYIAEYDALPEVGHACGHNLIGTMSVGAGIALSKIQDGLGGRIVVLGSPDEEGGGGKISLVTHGYFDDVDAALMIHPGDKDVKRKFNLAAFPVVVEFRGKPAHAASEPFSGINALDAMIQLFNNIGLLRQQLQDDVRIHGIITHGGAASNIIPDYTRGEFIVRASELNRTYETLEKFKRCVKAAAMATGASEEIQVDLEHKYEPLMTNNVLMDLYAENMRILGIDVEEQVLSELGGSSDIGNVSQVVPAIHPTGRIVQPGKEVPGHSYEFALASKSDEAKQGMLRGIQTLAMCGVDLLGNPDILDAAKNEFQQKTAG
ncbi:amidohydrolase [candidate division KSB3 bacterium]|uniref:Peptidase M20 domain-containing protein 2 n=1 Tax=candidate division KSB3 bacterium TaxID=2044937 RepID=A0A2G6KN76_9BACT|nr:MAG: amidohydrolase [candidate division KSB3 bacterium]